MLTSGTQNQRGWGRGGGRKKKTHKTKKETKTKRKTHNQTIKQRATKELSLISSGIILN